MADIKDITPDLDRLDGQLDDLEEKLQPLIGNLEGMASELPLLDKAKLFSLTAYAIESLLFCEYLRPAISKLSRYMIERQLTLCSITQTRGYRRAEPRRLP